MTTQEQRSRAATRSTVALLVSRVVISALGWAGSIVIARLLSPTAFGQYSFVFGLLGLLSVVTDLGVGRVVLARLIDDSDPDVPLVASSFIALRALLGLLGYACAVGYVLVLGYPGTVVRATALGGLVVVVATPSHALTMLFQARVKLTVVALAEAVGQFAQLVLTLVAALVAPTLLVFVLPVIVNELVKMGLKLRGVLQGEVGPLPARQVQLWRWRAMLADALPLTVGTALATLLYKVDLLLLSRLDTFTAVGLYSVGYKFADVLALVHAAVVNPVMPLLMGAFPGRPDTFRAQSRSTTLLLGAVGGTVVAGFWTSAHPLIVLLYGERFGAASNAARLVVLGACLALVSDIGFDLLVAAGKQRVYPLVGVLGLALNVGLNLVLIPRMSISGAALATIATEVLVLVVMWLLVARSVPVHRLLPVRELLVLAVTTALAAASATSVEGFLPWPVRAAAAGLEVLAVATVLDVPGTRGPLRQVLRRMPWRVDRQGQR